MPHCDKHRSRALVCRSRRRQRECSADRIPNCPRYVRRTQNDLPKNERKAPARIAVDPQGTGEFESLSEPRSLPTAPRRSSARCRPATCGAMPLGTGAGIAGCGDRFINASLLAKGLLIYLRDSRQNTNRVDLRFEWKLRFRSERVHAGQIVAFHFQASDGLLSSNTAMETIKITAASSVALLAQHMASFAASGGGLGASTITDAAASTQTQTLVAPHHA